MVVAPPIPCPTWRESTTMRTGFPVAAFLSVKLPVVSSALMEFPPMKMVFPLTYRLLNRLLADPRSQVESSNGMMPAATLMVFEKNTVLTRFDVSMVASPNAWLDVASMFAALIVPSASRLPSMCIVLLLSSTMHIVTCPPTPFVNAILSLNTVKFELIVTAEHASPSVPKRMLSPGSRAQRTKSPVFAFLYKNPFDRAIDRDPI